MFRTVSQAIPQEGSSVDPDRNSVAIRNPMRELARAALDENQTTASEGEHDAKVHYHPPDKRAG